MKNKTKKKSLLATLFALFIFSGSALATSTYAYWNMLTKTQDETVQLGEGVAVTVAADVVAPAGKALVPAGTLSDESTQVEEVTLTYNVGFNKPVTKTFNLEVVASAAKIGGSADHAALVNIIITAPATVDNAGAVVSVTVTLTEPADEVTYLAIINKAITFTLTFTTALA